MYSSKTWLFCLCSCYSLLLGTGRGLADVSLAPLFQKNAVLQQEKPLPIWGIADAGEAISVTYTASEATPGDSQTLTTTADANGHWSVQMKALKASASPSTLVVTGKNTIKLEGLLVGEVWLAAGQSNMDMALFWTERGKQEAKAADYPLIRYVKVPTVSSGVPMDTARLRWSTCKGAQSEKFSEVGYFFARELQQQLSVPIGIINVSWGGTAIQSWISQEALAKDPAGTGLRENWQRRMDDLPAKKAAYEELLNAWGQEKAAADAKNEKFGKKKPTPPPGPTSQNAPSGLYNAMVHPLIPYAIRGVIWYQGENNVRKPEEYRTLFPSLIRDWRTRFQREDLPFFWVQLPNFNIPEKEADWAGLREAQSLTLALPGTGQAVTVDIGIGREIHPANKPEVARRLSLLAFSRVYGEKNVIDSGPVFDHADFPPDAPVRISFKQLAAGLENKAADPSSGLRGFEIAGADKIFHPADARLDAATNTVLLSAKSVPTPIAARYAWRNNPTGLTLSNREGLPLAPFRTDDW